MTERTSVGTNKNQEDSSSARPSVVSLAPNSGGGTGQVFTLEFFDNNGYQAISSAVLVFDTDPPGNKCQVIFDGSQSQNFLYLVADDGNSNLGPISLPGSEALQNSR